MPKVYGNLWIGNDRVTLKEFEFLDHYLNVRSPTFLNHVESGLKVYGNRKEGWNRLNNPRIKRCIKELVQEGTYDEMIHRGFQHILSDPDHKSFQATCDKIFKLRGDYAPDKSMTLEISAEEVRAERAQLAESLKQLGGKREQIGRTELSAKEREESKPRRDKKLIKRRVEE